MKIKVVAALSAVALLAGAGLVMSAEPASAGWDREKSSYGERDKGDWSRDHHKGHHWDKERDKKDGRYGDKDRSKDRHKDHGKHRDRDRGKDHGKIVEKTFTKLVPASHPQQEWKSEITVTIKKSVPKYGDAKVISVTKELTGCFNHQGNPVGGYANNPNCQPAK